MDQLHTTLQQESNAGWQDLALSNMPLAMIVTDPHQDDNPIIYVNKAFESMTGYQSSCVLGRNCRFLQGPETDVVTIENIRNAITERREVTVDILNYRANGEKFWNRLLIYPLYDKTGELCNFIGIQRPLGEINDGLIGKDATAEDMIRELQHRVKNHLQMIVSMVRLQARTRPSAYTSDYTNLANRIDALQHLYSELIEGQGHAGRSTVPLGAYLGRIVSAVGYLDGRSGISLSTEADSTEVRLDIAGRLGLLVSELVTNAYQHAFENREKGRVSVRISSTANGRLHIDIGDDGRGLPVGSQWPQEGGTGAKIVQSLVAGLDGQLNIATGENGTNISIDVPIT